MTTDNDQQIKAEFAAEVAAFVKAHMADGGTREEAFALMRALITDEARSTFKIVPKSEKDGE